MERQSAERRHSWQVRPLSRPLLPPARDGDTFQRMCLECFRSGSPWLPELHGGQAPPRPRTPRARQSFTAIPVLSAEDLKAIKARKRVITKKSA